MKGQNPISVWYLSASATKWEEQQEKVRWREETVKTPYKKLFFSINKSCNGLGRNLKLTYPPIICSLDLQVICRIISIENNQNCFVSVFTKKSNIIKKKRGGINSITSWPNEFWNVSNNVIWLMLRNSSIFLIDHKCAKTNITATWCMRSKLYVKK